MSGKLGQLGERNTNMSFVWNFWPNDKNSAPGAQLHTRAIGKTCWCTKNPDLEIGKQCKQCDNGYNLKVFRALKADFHLCMTLEKQHIKPA